MIIASIEYLHPQRISLFRKYVARDKESLGISSSVHSSSRSTIITVHRSRLIEVSQIQFYTFIYNWFLILSFILH